MKRNFDDLKLLDAALSDERWEACSARLRSEGLVTLRAAKQIRRRWAIGGQIAAMITVIGGLWVGLRGTKAPTENRASNVASAPKTLRTRVAGQDHIGNAEISQQDKESYVTEEQMLAMFPKGSCVLAEINGEKRLVLLGEPPVKDGAAVVEGARDSKASNSRPQTPGKS